jgi:hypothetical protein
MTWKECAIAVLAAAVVAAVPATVDLVGSNETHTNSATRAYTDDGRTLALDSDGVQLNHNQVLL